MKALIKSVVCVALGWLASAAGAQEVPIKWQATSPKTSNPGVTAKTDAGVRPISLSQPVPLDGGTGSFAPIVRMQAPDDKIVQPVPKLEVIGPDLKTPKKMPDKEGFTPPPPQPTPSPIFGGLGMHADDGCFGGDPSWCGRGCFGGGPAWCGRGCFDRDGCSDRPRFWGSAEYLMWWQRSQSVPPLVTTSPAGTATINTGVLGQNGTGILYDGTPNTTHSGGRFAFGTWCPHFCNLGLEGSFFFLGRQDDTAIFGSNGNPQIARPIFNIVTRQPGSELVAVNNPDRFVTGTIAIHNFSQLWGADVNLRRRWLCGPTHYVDLLLGYRHVNLSEGIDVAEDLQVFNPTTRQPAGNFLVRDSFNTRNQFNGVQLGLDSECRFWSRMFLGLTSKVAFGSVHQSVDINGSTNFTNFPGQVGGTFPGGLLALPGTNIGHFTATRFGFMSEVGLKVGIDLNDHWRVFVGYNVIYLNNVVRPGDQIDLRVNPTFQPSAAGPGTAVGPRVPAVLFKTSDYWAQGLNFGLLYRY